MGLITRRALGTALLVAVYAPFHRLLDPSSSGLAGQVTRAVSEVVWVGGLWGSGAVIAASVVLGRWLSWDPTDLIRRGTTWLNRIPGPLYVGGLAAVSLACAGTVSGYLLGGKPTSVDGMVQLLHAQALASGHAVLPLPGDPAAWMVQNSFMADGGWTSVYPPLHTLWLALWLAVGLPWMAGPVSVATLSAFTFLSLRRLFPRRPLFTRTAGLVVSLTPFLLFLGGTHLSHATAGALCALTLWALLRARDGSLAWGIIAGGAIGALVCTRPWSGLTLGSALTLGVLLPSAHAQTRGWLVRRLTAIGAGGLPFALGLASWNQALNGGPFRLGYSVAFGPAHGLGLHTDPWGNRYGFVEALAYTGSDLSLLGSHLLETPLPAVAVVGLGMILIRRFPPGATPLLAWALAGVVANAAYWHHGIHMGPRLLYETGAAWAALWVLGFAVALRVDSPLSPIERRTVAWVAILSVLGAGMLVPERARSYRPQPRVAGAALLPDPGALRSLVFVHGSWSSRVSARLTTAGMRRDSVETLLRRNDLCSVDRYARWRTNPAGDAPTLATEALPGPGPGLEGWTLAPGNTVPRRPGLELDAGCRREAHADRLGSVELEPLLWQAPPRLDADLVVARDLGPAANAATREAFSGHTAWVAVEGDAGAPARILEYEEGMELLWGGAAALSGAGG